MNQIEWIEPQTPNQIMDEAIQKHKIDKVYVLYSGGKDSSCVGDWISKNYPDIDGGRVFTNVGLGSQQTRKFVIDYCKERNWKLWMTWNHSEKDRFYNVLMQYGFAFQGNHRMWMGFLKQHSWYYFMKWRLSLGEKACFISGVRKKESIKRNKISKYTKTPIDVNAGQIYVKPFLYKNGSQLWDYFIENKLKKTPVYEWLNRSGECYCGAFAEPWDLKLMETHDKLAFDTIKWYEKQMEIKLNGLIKEHSVTETQLENWYRLYHIKHLRDTLTPLQTQMVSLKYFNKWGNKINIVDAIKQRTLDEIFGKEVVIRDDYCGESCFME